MKDFSAFLASLTQGDMDYINGASDTAPVKFCANAADPNFMTELAALIASCGFSMSTRMLEKYHVWLIEQLERDVLHPDK